MNGTLTKNGFRVLTLTLAALLAVSVTEPASAGWGRLNRSRAWRKVRGTPNTIPQADDVLNRMSVITQFAMMQVGAPVARTVSQGAGVTVAVLDGGFDLRHEALAGRIHSAKWDTIDVDSDPQDLGNGIDGDNDGRTDALVGHGTFTSSIILGVAPNAMILPIRVLDDEGYGTEEDVVEGIHLAIAQGAKVINLSLILPDASWSVKAALRLAHDLGVVVVGSAGYESTSWQNDPELANKVFAVGAVDSLDVLMPWSATGWRVDAYAPGNMIVGALGGAIPNSYAYWSGTSFSTPFTSGGAALLVAVHPNWSVPQVIDKIRTTADPAFFVLPSWRGRINLGAALTQ